MNNFEYKTSVPFLRWFYPEDKQSDLASIYKRRGVVPELILGFILYASFNSWTQTSQSVGNLIIYLFWVIILLGLFTLALVNGKTMLLPDKITRPLTLAVVVFQVLVAIQTNNSGVLGSAVIGGLLVGGIPYILFQVSKGRWIGGGDVKMGFLAGLLLGWKLGLFCIGFMVLLTGISMLAEFVSSKASKTHTPFRIGTGVLWVTSILLALLIGQQVIN
jgi:leader peptidase (prepilin peptidase)/N-methyltransferase